MKKILRDFQFWFDYNIGYFLTNGNKLHHWEKMIIEKYPDKFNNKK